MSAPIGKRRSAAFEFLCRCLSARPDDDLAGAAAEAAASTAFGWTEFVDLATDQLVAPLVARRLEQCALDDVVPEMVGRYFNAMHRLNVTRNTHLKEQALAVASALNDIDIVPIFFKGSAGLLSGLYEDPGSRVMSDLDTLVPADCGDAAVKRLAGLGYRVEPVMVHPRAYSIAKLVGASRSAAVDLHRDALAYPDQALLPVADVVHDAVTLKVDGATLAVPSATHQVIINVGHAQLKDHCALYGRLPLRALHDFSLLVETPRHVDWQEVENRFASRRARRALNAHRHAAHELLNVDVGARFTPGRAARLALVHGRFMIKDPALHRMSCRLIRVFVMLKQELSSADLRIRLARNVTDPAWWRRNLTLLAGGDPKRQ